MVQSLLMNFPVFGKIIIYNEVTMFTKTFASLLNHNVYITDCMEVLSKITGNEVYKMLIFDTIANLTIERTDDAPFDPNYADWVEVTANGPFNNCNTTGKTLVDVDISADNFNITLGSDGYYYTDDGKAVYLRLTSAPNHSYMDDDFNIHPVFGGTLALIAGLVEGQDVGNNIGGYVYDEEGNFLNKYRYNQMIETYLEYVDTNYGVVQLNEELAECIKLHGESSGWYNPDGYGYLFENIEVNDDISWLFLCMVEQ